jgi:hypothetical protein
MTEEYRINVATRDGVYGLSRVVNVLALLAITPLDLRCRAVVGGMRIDIRFRAAPETSALCRARLGAIPSIDAVAEAPYAVRPRTMRRVPTAQPARLGT